MNRKNTFLKLEILKQRLELIELTIKLFKILNDIKSELLKKNKGAKRLNHVYDLEDLEILDRKDDSGCESN